MSEGMVTLDEFSGGAIEVAGQEYVLVPRKTLDLADMRLDSEFAALERELATAQEITRTEIERTARLEAVRATRNRERELRMHGAAWGAAVVAAALIAIHVLVP